MMNRLETSEIKILEALRAAFERCAFITYREHRGDIVFSIGMPIGEKERWFKKSYNPDEFRRGIDIKKLINEANAEFDRIKTETDGIQPRP